MTEHKSKLSERPNEAHTSSTGQLCQADRKVESFADEAKVNAQELLLLAAIQRRIHTDDLTARMKSSLCPLLEQKFKSEQMFTKIQKQEYRGMDIDQCYIGGPDWLEEAESSIPGAGRGTYAKARIPGGRLFFIG